jgi:hypothetical protein
LTRSGHQRNRVAPADQVYERLVRRTCIYDDKSEQYLGKNMVIGRDAGQIHRAVTLSVYVWDWPEQLEERLVEWENLGVARTFLTFWHPFEHLERASQWMS